MRIPAKTKFTYLLSLAIFLLVPVLTMTPAYGLTTCPDGRVVLDSEADTCAQGDNVGGGSSVTDPETGLQVPVDPDAGKIKLGEKSCEEKPLTKENCNIILYLVNGINLMSAIAGMAIVGSVMLAGYQYMTARDNSGTVQKSKERIMWAMIALGLYIFMYAILNYLVPGGVI